MTTINIEQEIIDKITQSIIKQGQIISSMKSSLEEGDRIIKEFDERSKLNI